jgi:putative polyhydroxyalkanoate system protein
MAKISIFHRHGLDMDQARAKLKGLAAQLEQKYRLKFSWNGDAVALKGTGVQGDLRLAEGQISGELDVPFFLKGKVEKALRERLGQEFPA